MRTSAIEVVFYEVVLSEVCWSFIANAMMKSFSFARAPVQNKMVENAHDSLNINISESIMEANYVGTPRLIRPRFKLTQ